MPRSNRRIHALLAWHFGGGLLRHSPPCSRVVRPIHMFLSRSWWMSDRGGSRCSSRAGSGEREQISHEKTILLEDCIAWAFTHFSLAGQNPHDLNLYPAKSHWIPNAVLRFPPNMGSIVNPCYWRSDFFVSGEFLSSSYLAGIPLGLEMVWNMDLVLECLLYTKQLPAP